MTKVDFYVLKKEETPEAKIAFVCRLIEKAYKNSHRIYIHTENAKEAHLLDEKLWTYRDESFLPHNLYGEGPATAPPIQIGYDITPEKHRDILVNLSHTIPTFYAQFNRILEIISGDDKEQALARERFKAYRANGCALTTHKLETVD